MLSLPQSDDFQFFELFLWYLPPYLQNIATSSSWFGHRLWISPCERLFHLYWPLSHAHPVHPSLPIYSCSDIGYIRIGIYYDYLHPFTTDLFISCKTFSFFLDLIIVIVCPLVLSKLSIIQLKFCQLSTSLHSGLSGILSILSSQRFPSGAFSLVPFLLVSLCLVHCHWLSNPQFLHL